MKGARFMKKIFKLTLAVFIVLMVFLALTSCSEQQRAVNLLNKLDDILQEADSFSVENELTVTGKSGDRYLTLTQTTTQDVMGKNSGVDSASLIKVIYDYDYQLDSFDSMVMVMQGYNAEYMYRRVILGNTEISLKSPVTEENKQSFVASLLGSTAIDRDTLSYTEQDGCMIVGISSLNGQEIEEMGLTIGALTPGYDITSANVTITVSEDYSSWESRVDYVFEKSGQKQNDGEYTPSATLVASFGGFNSTTVEEVNLDGYIECDDVGIISRVANDLTDKLLLPHSGASIDVVNSFSYHNMIFSLKQCDIISYGTNDKGFYSKIVTLADDERKETTYSEGVKKEGSRTSYLTDTEERINIFSAITVSAYNDLLICDVQRLESDPNTYSMKVFVGETYPNYEDISSIRIIVTYEDGFLSKMKVQVRCYAPVNGERTFQNIDYEIKYFAPTE